MMPKFFLIFFSAVLIFSCSPEKDAFYKKQPTSLPFQKISFNNYKSFQNPGANWTISGDVRSNYKKDHSLKAVSGKGIAVNIPTEQERSHLFTKFKHGDIELELDFLMPKGSNSGIYLQGRYEIQLFDSWKVDNPKYSDCGGIYTRWDESKPEGERRSGGKAPDLNAARAPGLWQHLKVLFHAPKFDESGNKTENAIFKKVYLNGVLIHENVEVKGPTRAAAFEDEQPTGPLMIQGDHGPLAIKNIRYKKYSQQEIQLSNLKYQYYEGEFDSIPDFSKLEVLEEGPTDSISRNLGKGGDHYALRFSGEMEIPFSGKYLFQYQGAGMAEVSIGQHNIAQQDTVHEMENRETLLVELEKGKYPFQLNYVSHPKPWRVGLAFYGEGPELRKQPFHTKKSLPGGGEAPDPITVTPEKHPLAIRGFMNHHGTKLTRTISVGGVNTPNYTMDLDQGALIYVWGGPFLNTTKMWHGRGHTQLAEPNGATVTLKGNPSIAFLNDEDAPWPEKVPENAWKFSGYVMDDEGWPAFQYQLEDIKVEDYVRGHNSPRSLTRSLFINSPDEKSNLWFRIASGKEIFHEPETNVYAIGDRKYYLNINDIPVQEPVIRSQNGRQELLVPILRNSSNAAINYDIIW